MDYNYIEDGYSLDQQAFVSKLDEAKINENLPYDQFLDNPHTAEFHRIL